MSMVATSKPCLAMTSTANLQTARRARVAGSGKFSSENGAASSRNFGRGTNQSLLPVAFSETCAKSWWTTPQFPAWLAHTNKLCRPAKETLELLSTTRALLTVETAAIALERKDSPKHCAYMSPWSRCLVDLVAQALDPLISPVFVRT